MKQKSGGHGEKRTRKLEAFIQAMLASPTVEQAAASVGVSRTTAWRWVKDAGVAARLRAARKEALQQAMAELQQASVEAVRALRELLRTAESESAKVSCGR